MKLTQDQMRVVETRNKDILVSAAAGSGKTAVLIQRIMSRITDEDNPIDVDRLLIVTFTKAAAAEMRERLHQAICNMLKEDPDNENLQKQATLIHNTLITTIDSFCLFILKNHFHEINLDPAFRIADPGEMKLIEKEVLKDTLEEFYEKGSDAFFAFCDAYSPNAKDEKLEELVEQLYRYSMSHPWPLIWLEECRMTEQDLSLSRICKKEWMQYGWKLIGETILDCLHMARRNLAICEMPCGPSTYAEAIESDIDSFEMLVHLCERELGAEVFDECRDKMAALSFATLSRKKDEGVDINLKEMVKMLRDQYKKLSKELSENLLGSSFARILEKEKCAAAYNDVLIDVTKQFIENLTRVKREKNLLDFSDAEHLALSILWEDGEPTATARSYQDYFAEVMIDEYQDSNMVQELLLSCVSSQKENAHNRFMVGDMKQSIYRFRLACPQIFLDKYEKYQAGDSQNTLISLKKNFRSRKEVLDSVNEVFYKVMQPSVGNICYDANAALYPGADYGIDYETCEREGTWEKDTIYKTELCLFEKKGQKGEDAREAEAKMIAKRIREMVGFFPIMDEKDKHGGKEKVSPKKRKASYRDIVILTRSEKNVIETLQSVLTREGIPVYVSSKSGYFTALEISVLMEMLRVLANPYQDISFVATATSMFFSFTEEELASIRTYGKDSKSIYEAFLEAKDAKEGIDLRLVEKVKDMLLCISHLRQEAVVKSVSELVQYILTTFHYLEYVTAMPAGQQRRANVEMFLEKTVDFEKTSFHGLFHFIRYMEQLKKYEVDYGEASVLSQSADVVRIMTIHKSKGLEFPICFVVGMNRKFNLRDNAGDILIDADWGIASNYIDLDHYVMGKTMRKNLLAQYMKRESLGEELRVLYVAMTRAKEKLILTGIIEDAEKLGEKYAYLRYDNRTDSIPDTALAGANSFLDYLLMALARGSDYIDLSIKHAEDLQLYRDEDDLTQLVKYTMLEKRREFEEKLEKKGWEADETQKKRLADLKEKMDFVYPYKNLASLRVKTSVSELKKAAMEDAGLHPMFETDSKDEPYYPAFAVKEQKAGGTERGNAYHRAMELIDFAAFDAFCTAHNPKEKEMLRYMEEVLEEKREDGLISAQYIDLLSMEKLVAFLTSDVAGKMARAQREGKLKKEQPFVLSVEASRLDAKYPSDEVVLIQGIIDVFFEDEDGQLVILDYKTDRVSNLKELLDRYRTQLDYYEEAVERITGKKVKEKILYSFAKLDAICWK